LALLCEAFLDGCLQREDFETPFQLLRMTASFHQVTASSHHHHHHHGTATATSSHSLFESRLNSRMSSNSSNASSPAASFHEVTNEEQGVTSSSSSSSTSTMFSEVHYATSESEPTTPVRIRNESSESQQQQQQQHQQHLHHEIEVLSARLAEHRLFVDTRLWESKLESKLRTESGQDDSSYAESAVSLLLLSLLLCMIN
jgi:hypothetical protein